MKLLDDFLAIRFILNQRYERFGRRRSRTKRSDSKEKQHHQNHCREISETGKRHPSTVEERRVVARTTSSIPCFLPMSKTIQDGLKFLT
jgi:hypothetical protein